MHIDLSQIAAGHSEGKAGAIITTGDALAQIPVVDRAGDVGPRIPRSRDVSVRLDPTPLPESYQGWPTISLSPSLLSATLVPNSAFEQPVVQPVRSDPICVQAAWDACQHSEAQMSRAEWGLRSMRRGI